MKTLQDLFRRYRRPGDFFIALLSFLFAIFLLISLPSQAPWLPKVKTFAQPAFWPGVAVICMVLFSSLHLAGALFSERIPGRLAEVIEWIKAVEFAAWFMLYVWLVPILGYLPSTLAFTVLLTLRLGYRGWRWMLTAVLFGTLVVLIFKGFLNVRIPAGDIYQVLPAGPFRTFVMTYL
ncbi:tripartite tricarboxylate transporter TctB family protein [Pseudooceanicola sp.]|uniref:tripartite tricarboxylate transporter TctB family protein n=1 Tax=Pseudooceanicola sp. TaxID=1914328 RepID=UPI0035C780A2